MKVVCIKELSNKTLERIMLRYLPVTPWRLLRMYTVYPSTDLVTVCFSGVNLEGDKKSPNDRAAIWAMPIDIFKEHFKVIKK